MNILEDHCLQQHIAVKKNKNNKKNKKRKKYYKACDTIEASEESLKYLADSTITCLNYEFITCGPRRRGVWTT